MAQRPIYIPCFTGNLLVKTSMVDFKWHAGMAASQKQKSIAELHSASKELGLCKSPLEISSKSTVELGIKLSAFNLSVKTEKLGKVFTVETAFQASKVFQNGGPYTDLLYTDSRSAKKDVRIKESGELISFNFFNQTWPLEPKTAFYDWLYLNALSKSKALVESLAEFDSFTDIEFNPKKSINCQAYSVALFLSLSKRGLLADSISDQASFLKMLANFAVDNAHESTVGQPNLL